MTGSMQVDNNRTSPTGWFGFLWGVAGFAWILLDAILRLSHIAVEVFSSGLSAAQWVLVVIVVTFMAYAEGYRGFQLSFSPRTAARALYLRRHPDLLAAVLAPLFCMGFFRATRRVLLIAWVGTALIIILIIGLRLTPQPWRSIVDAGVVVGLTWGLVSFLWNVRQGLRSGSYPTSPEVPSL